MITGVYRGHQVEVKGISEDKKRLYITVREGEPFYRYDYTGAKHYYSWAYVPAFLVNNLRSTRIIKLDELSTVIHDLTLSNNKEEAVKWENNHPRMG